MQIIMIYVLDQLSIILAMYPLYYIYIRLYDSASSPRPMSRIAFVTWLERDAYIADNDEVCAAAHKIYTVACPQIINFTYFINSDKKNGLHCTTQIQKKQYIKQPIKNVKLVGLFCYDGVKSYWVIKLSKSVFSKSVLLVMTWYNSIAT